MGEISLIDFAAYIDAAVTVRPNAKVLRVGTRASNGRWCFFVQIKNNEGYAEYIDIPFMQN